MTLLELVTDILNDMESDPVSSIVDTEEADQVARIIRTTYFNIIDGREWPHLYTLFQLTQTDANTPTRLTIPNNIVRIKYVKYDKVRSGETRNRYEEIYYKTPHEFMDMLNARLSTESTVDVITDTSGLPINVYNNRPPQYYTSFDDDSIVMDAYDSAVESFLTTAKNQCYVKKYPTFDLCDDFYADLPTEGFSYLLAESKATAFQALKQIPNQKAEQHSISQRRRMSWDAWNIDKKNTYPDFGRKRVK